MHTGLLHIRNVDKWLFRLIVVVRFALQLHPLGADLFEHNAS